MSSKFQSKSIFLLVGVLDLLLNFPGYHRWRFTSVLRIILKIIVSLIWVVILPILYAHSFDGAPDFLKDMMPFLKEVDGVPPFYILAVALYMLPNILTAALFIFPMLRRWIENSDWHIIRLLLWWSQVLVFPCYFLSFPFLFSCFFLSGWTVSTNGAFFPHLFLIVCGAKLK